MNGEGSHLAPTGNENVRHVAEGNEGEHKKKNADGSMVRSCKQSQHGGAGGEIPNAFQVQPGEGMGIRGRQIEAK